MMGLMGLIHHPEAWKLRPLNFGWFTDSSAMIFQFSNRIHPKYSIIIDHGLSPETSHIFPHLRSEAASPFSPRSAWCLLHPRRHVGSGASLWALPGPWSNAPVEHGDGAKKVGWILGRPFFLWIDGWNALKCWIPFWVKCWKLISQLPDLVGVKRWLAWILVSKDIGDIGPSCGMYIYI